MSSYFLALPEYLQLLDWTGRQLRSDKRGTIPHQLVPILERLNLDATLWPTTVADFPRLFRFAAGRVEHLVREAERRGAAGFTGSAAQPGPSADAIAARAERSTPLSPLPVCAFTTPREVPTPSRRSDPELRPCSAASNGAPR